MTAKTQEAVAWLRAKESISVWYDAENGERYRQFVIRGQNVPSDAPVVLAHPELFAAFPIGED